MNNIDYNPHLQLQLLQHFMASAYQYSIIPAKTKGRRSKGPRFRNEKVKTNHLKPSLIPAQHLSRRKSFSLTNWCLTVWYHRSTEAWCDPWIWVAAGHPHCVWENWNRCFNTHMVSPSCSKEERPWFWSDHRLPHTMSSRCSSFNSHHQTCHGHDHRVGGRIPRPRLSTCYGCRLAYLFSGKINPVALAQTLWGKQICPDVWWPHSEMAALKSIGSLL